MKEVTQININEISVNKNQLRLEFSDETIEGLADSIKDNGLLQPITVRKVDNGYELVSGERRLKACKMNGMEEIEAIRKLLFKKKIKNINQKHLIKNIQ